MNKTEVFKPVPVFSKYEISNLGNLKTFNWRNTGRTAIMKPALCKDGYLRTMLLRDDGKYCTVKIHQLACATWHGPKPFPKAEVNHKDTIKTNNAEDNLEWCTRRYNMQHAYDNGLVKTWKGVDHPKAQVTEAQVLEIRRRFKKRIVTRKMLSEEFGVSEDIVKSIVTRKTWKHL